MELDCGTTGEVHVKSQPEAQPLSVVVPKEELLTAEAMVNVTAEIKTGKRRVIEYLLSPVQTAVREGL